MPEPSSTKSVFRTGLLLALCLSASLGGMVLRERNGIREAPPALGRLIASKDGQPIPEDDYFTELVQILKSEYVEPVADDMKFATGAVRGMVSSLNDLHSLYYDPDEFRVVQRALNGKYEGIGVELNFVYPPARNGQGADRIPRVNVLSVVPGGPAARAGLMPGDMLESVDGHWIVNSVFLDHIRDVQQKVQEKKLPTSELDKLRREFRDRIEGAIPPMRAWRRLMVGSTGSVRLAVHRKGQEKAFQISRGASARRGETGYTRLSFLPGTESSVDGAAKFDLRGSSGGDFETMVAMLRRLGVSGSIGSLQREGKRSPVPITLKAGRSSLPPIQVLVDRQTQGVPEIFALALKKAGAKVVGSTAGKPVATEFARLPDGSGYSLHLGTFKGATR